MIDEPQPALLASLKFPVAYDLLKLAPQTAPKRHDELVQDWRGSWGGLKILRKSGAGEGIRTLDPNLGNHGGDSPTLKTSPEVLMAIIGRMAGLPKPGQPTG